MTKIDRSTYQALANKLSTGTPSQYFVQRFATKTRITVYLTPSSSTNKYLNFYYIKEFRMQVLIIKTRMLLIDFYLR